MSPDWRTGAIAAGAAFILSLLAGLIGGVAFGTLLIRAIIGAVVFGAGAVVVSLLVERYLPELKSATVETLGGSSDDRLGGRIDITVDDSMDTDMDSGFVLDGESEDPSEPEDDDFVEGIAAEQVHAEAETADAEPVDAEDGDGGAGEIAELEEAGEEDDEQDPVRRAAESAPETGSAQSLPDIEGFSGSFAEAPAEVEDLDGAQNSGEDPSIMARAIRTVLKREE